MEGNEDNVADGSPASWPGIITPGGSEDNEELLRQIHDRPRRANDIGAFPRHMRPAIRRRIKDGERPGRGRNTPKGLHISTSETLRALERSISSSSDCTYVTPANIPCAKSAISPSEIVGEVQSDDQYEREDNKDDLELLVPKLEPIDDDDVDMADFKEDAIADILSATSTSHLSSLMVKRPRGRPRKHPRVNPDSLVKAAKGRSKTGCITCRKRKKKCDETKPGCMNCEKNSVTCEGYPEKTIWKSGKEKAEEARMRRDSSTLNIKLEPVISGIETIGDKMFFEHYIFRLSGILTVEIEQNHSFKDMLLQMAVKHVGLMHSILALSSKHIDLRSPYAIQFLQDHPDLDITTLEERSQFHHERAMVEFMSGIERPNQESASEDFNMSPAIYGQMICLVLGTLADPNPTGQHRLHLRAYPALIQQYPPEDQDFFRFIDEFFQYHIIADGLIHLPEGRPTVGTASDEWKLPTAVLQPGSMRFLGVSDSLLPYMSKITNVRDIVRENLRNGVDPAVDYTLLYRAIDIDAAIREWSPLESAGDSRHLAGMLYKQMMWIYLWRTIYPPRTRDWNPRDQIVKAVDDGIDLLSQFDRRDPSQTLILAPAFVIGCAAFEERQREPVRKAIGVVKEYMQYKNSDCALLVLEEVWKLMDAKSEDSWDWQTIAHKMGLDFLAT